MKILISLEVFYPHISGVTIFTKKLAHFLEKSGDEVLILTGSLSGKTHNETLDGLNLIRLGSVPNPFKKGLRFALFSRNKIRKILDEFKPDIVDLQDPNPISIRVLKEAKKRNIPIILRHHFSFEFALIYIPKIPLIYPLVKKLIIKHLVRFYNEVNLITTPSETTKRMVEGLGIVAPIAAVSNGIDLDRFMPGKPADEFYLRYSLPRGKPLILFSGRVDPDKNLRTLISAVPNIIKEFDVYFVLLGKGTDIENLKSIAKEKDVLDRLIFPGAIRHENQDLVKMYQSATLFVIPSPVETQSIVVLEAMACGLPIVAAKSGALPELVKNNLNGFLIEDVFNPRIYGEAILKILKDKELANKFSQNSLEIIKIHEATRVLTEYRLLYDRAKSNLRK